MSIMIIRRIALSLALAITLQACSGSDSKTGGAVDLRTLTSTIPVTRAACTPFGAVPSVVSGALDGAFNPTCLPGGEKLERWADGDGTMRDACLFEPASASTEHKLPLLIYLHPSLVGTDLSLDVSNIRSQLETADLSGDPDKPGFIMLAPYGRVGTRYYPLPDQDYSPGWDNWYRQMLPDGQERRVNGTTYAANVDAAAIDHYLALVLAQGKVDPKRIYIMGWSNGSAMATLYALNRPQIAAAAVYSSPDPFGAFNDPCVQQPVVGEPKDDTELQLLHPQVPIYHMHNACDIAGLCPNSLRLRDTLAAGGATLIDDHIVNTALNDVAACNALCGTDPLANYAGLDDPSGYLDNIPGYAIGTVNHLRWPFSRTADLFGFLRDHPKP
jgi:predicted esterase